jgi:hypothetical protein
MMETLREWLAIHNHDLQEGKRIGIAHRLEFSQDTIDKLKVLGYVE